MPKSIRRQHLLCIMNRTFSGLMSRCTVFAACTVSKDVAMSNKSLSTSGKDSLPCHLRQGTMSTDHGDVMVCQKHTDSYSRLPSTFTHGADARHTRKQLGAHVDKLKPRSSTMNGGKGHPLLDLTCPSALFDERMSSGRVSRIEECQYSFSSSMWSLEFSKNLMAYCLSLPSFSRANCSTGNGVIQCAIFVQQHACEDVPQVSGTFARCFNNLCTAAHEFIVAKHGPTHLHHGLPTICTRLQQFPSPRK